MEEEEGGMRLSKSFSDKGGEVDYKTISGTAWSRNFLNQKPWHPLSYNNQRRKWIVEQQHAQHQRREEVVACEMEMMQVISFMYVRPPGYNAESAKAAELAAEDNKNEHPSEGVPSSSILPQASTSRWCIHEGRKEED